MYYLGLDVGTSALKTTVIDENQQIVYESTNAYFYDQPQEGYYEIDPDVWFGCVLSSLKDISSSYDFKAIGVTGQMHTTVFLDENGKSVRKAIMWNDLRSVDLVAPLKEEVAQYEQTKYIARIISTGSPAINTLWVKENEPENFKRIAHIMTAYDYIVYRLTGNYSVDYCDAATSSMYDIQTKAWSSIMMEKLGVDASILGTVHASCDVIGQVKESLCEELGVSSSIDVIAGTGDNPASATAMGILNKNTPVISLGTSGVIILPKADGEFEGKGKNVLFKAKADDAFVNVVQGTVRSAGGAHKWWVEKIVQTDDMAVDQESIKIKKNEVMFFPHITGDKLIYKDMNVRGAFIGLGIDQKRSDMTQAVFEGVGYALREVMENLEMKEWPTHMEINGGGSRSPLWMQILSNILHTELEVVSAKATPGYGACLLAYLASHEDISFAPVKGKVYRPDPEWVDMYGKEYQKYKRIYSALKQIA